MADNGTNESPKLEEPPCPFWQKKCSEVNAVKPGCKKFITVFAVKPGAITTQSVSMCQDDFLAGTMQKVLQILMQRQKPTLPQGLLRGLNQ